MKPKLSDLWRWDGNIDRGTYLFWGVLLAALKFNIDRFVGAQFFDKPWTLLDSEFLRLYLWQSGATLENAPYYLALLAGALPFLWAGTALTLRRLRSLGWSPWWILLFFVPVLKLIFFTVLCFVPTQPEMETAAKTSKHSQGFFATIIPQNKWGAALVGLLISVSVTLVVTFLGTAVLRDYGWSIFVGLPFGMGLSTVLIQSYHRPLSFGACLAAANATVIVAGIGLLLFAMEGGICLLMAAPLAFPIATIGGIVGYMIQKTLYWRRDPARLYCAALLLTPLIMGLEHALPPPVPLLEVKSSVVVNATPEKVWQNVVSFSELPPPREMIFRLGVAYPIRAEIKGRGVGAIRHCCFSTGPFVEPIEVWDEPRLLKFSVTENPEPMQEWTPYHEIHPAHLDGYLESQAGQFRLIPLPDGKTLLEGTTWYRHNLWPADYWQVWSDQIIHTIHMRVLNHVKALSEKNAS